MEKKNSTRRIRRSSTEERRPSRSPPEHHLASTDSSTEKDLQMGSKAQVVYYLSRRWQIEHPHFVEVPITNPQGLFLRDVISKLCVLRGRRMVAMFSWSSCRSYKNGFVWHDVSEDDLIVPSTSSGNEYVLKGSEILDVSPMETKTATASPEEEADQHRNLSSSSESTSPTKIATATTTVDASTQTDATVGSNRWMSPLPKAETLEALLRIEPRITVEAKMRAGDVLKQLITCGSLPSPRTRRVVVDRRRAVGRREWHSGSLAEMHGRRDEGGGGALKRSSSQGLGERSCVSPLEMMKERRDKNLAMIARDDKKKTTTMTKAVASTQVSSGVPKPKSKFNANLASRNMLSRKGVLHKARSIAAEEKGEEKVLRIEERLISGARVIIQSRPQSEDGDGI